MQRRQSQGNCLPLSFTPVIGSHIIEKKDSPTESESPTKVPENENSTPMEVEEQEEEIVKPEEHKPMVHPQLTIKVDFAPDEIPEDQQECFSASQLTPTPKSFFKKNVEDGMDK